MKEKGKSNSETKTKPEKRPYSLEEAVNFLKENCRSNFDETIELHFHLGIDPSQTSQIVKGTLILPYGPIKPKKIAIFVSPGYLGMAKKAGADIVGSQELIDEIRENGKVDFDIAIAEPGIMKDLAKIARILGPRGLMPSPKSGTVTTEFEKTVQEFKKGKINFRNDESGNIHGAVGKISWPVEKTVANARVFIEAVEKARPAGIKGNYIKSITLSSTMGPGIKIEG